MLPNFLIIGAPKCGTTSLHHYLSQHPDVCMPRRKELHFFSRPNWSERLDWYESRFGAASARGEASTSYSMHPFRPDVPQRVHSVIPAIKLIYLVRDPIERLVAHYIEWVSLGFEHRALVDALGTFDGGNPYICASMYAAQLDQYLRFFPEDRILVLDQRQLLDRRESTLPEIFAFLEVDASYTSPEFGRLLNPRREKVALNRLGRWMANNRRVRRSMLRPLVRRRDGPSGSFSRLIGRPAPTPVLDPSSRVRLESLFRKDTARLRERTGKEFSGWSL